LEGHKSLGKWFSPQTLQKAAWYVVTVVPVEEALEGSEGKGLSETGESKDGVFLV
jgi:hypothetical protein